MPQFNKNNQMNNTEHQQTPNQEPRNIKRGLLKSIRDLFQNSLPDQANLVKDYLDKPPEKITELSKDEMQLKQTRRNQKTRFDNLKQSLVGANMLSSGQFSYSIIDQAKQAATEIASNTNTQSFQKNFYKKIAQIDVDTDHALPFARFVAESAETVLTTNSIASAKQKAELALEIFIGETGEITNSLPIVRKIISSIISSDSNSQINAYFQGKEFKELCQLYNLSESQINILIKDKDSGLDDDEDAKMQAEELNLEQHKNELLAGFDSVKDRVSLDLELLSLSSDKILTLLRTVDQDNAEPGYTNRDSDHLRNLNQPDQINRLLRDSTVNEWIDSYLSKYNYTGARAEQLKKQVMDYYLKFRNRVYLEKIKNYPKSRGFFGSARDPYYRWIDQLEDRIIAAELMLSSYDTFLYSEYFKGQTADAIIKESKLDEALKAAKDKDRFAVSGHLIYGDILHDIHQGYLAEMSQEGDQNYTQIKQRITQAINRMKMSDEVKEEVSYGSIYTRDPVSPGKRKKNVQHQGLDIIFEYSHYYEDVAEGGEFTEKGFFADPTLAHMTAVYPKAMEELKEAYHKLSEIVKIAESKGDAKGLIEAAGEVTNALVDVVVEQSPIATLAMQSYLRLIRMKLASNGGIITPDMFGSTSYVKGEFSKLLEMEVKNPYVITDFEKDVYLKMGMGLAFASGEMKAILANARPPMSLSINELPPAIARKIESGGVLTIKEMKALEGKFGPNFRDFSFRGMLINLNPLLWLHSWIKYNDYGVFQLVYTPYKTGENAIDPIKNYDITQQILFSTYLGLSEEAVEYFDGTYKIPALELAKMNQKMSMEKRGGVRERVKQLLRKDFEVAQSGGFYQVDGDKSFTKLMKESPVLAYSLLTDAAIADHVKVKWQVGSKSLATDELPAEFKEAKIKELIDYMHLYYPTFFSSIEQPMYFRRKELSFSQQIRENILQNLQQNTDRRGYWLLLNQKEASEAIAKSADIHPLGEKYMHEHIIGTQRVNERMTIMMMQLQTYLQEKGDRMADPRKNIRDFIMSSDPKAYDVGMFESLDKAVNNVINTYNLQPKNKAEIREMFIKYAKDVYYGKDSLYHTKKYLGNQKISGTDADKIKKLAPGMSIPDSIINKHGATLKDYYARLINQKIINEPFDWAYFDRTQLNYQATGLRMTGRHIGDYGHGYMEYSAKYMDAVKAIQDAISQPGESKKTLQDALDKFDGAINGIASGFTGAEAGEAGWLANAFINYPFIASRWKDTPIAGKIPLIHSWATLFNHDDRRHLNAFDATKRKEMLDHVLKKPWSEMMLHYLQDNQKLHDIAKEWTIFGKKVPIPHALRGIFGRQWEKIYSDPDADYSVKSMKSFMKIEDWWVGGKDNFGIGYNTLMTIIIIGLLLTLFQAIKEGMKEVEIK